VTWAPGPHPVRYDIVGLSLAFVPLTPALLDQDYAAVMRDVSMLQRWSGQEWPTPTFTRSENLDDLERHDREQREGVALTYSLLLPEVVQGCIYVRPFDDALRTRGVEPATPPSAPASDAVVRGWAHDIDAATLITSTRSFLSSADLSITRLWWQANTACPEQLRACDAVGLTDALEFPMIGTTWVLRAAPVVTIGTTVPA
jgi:hypothetical protein